jgi:hypothetical protein
MQKLDKPIELEGRIILYKPIVKQITKRNNQVGGSLKVGNHVKIINEKYFTSTFGKNQKRRQKIYTVRKIYPNKNEIDIRAIMEVNYFD